MDFELLRLTGEIRFATHRNVCCWSNDAHVVALHDAVLDRYVAGDLVERKALAEDILIVEAESAAQRLQGEHAEQLPGARVDLDELAGAGLDTELAGERRIVERLRFAVPGEIAADLGWR